MMGMPYRRLQSRRGLLIAIRVAMMSAWYRFKISITVKSMVESSWSTVAQAKHRFMLGGRVIDGDILLLGIAWAADLGLGRYPK